MAQNKPALLITWFNYNDAWAVHALQAVYRSMDCACRQGSTAMPFTDNHRCKPRARGDGRKAHVRLLQAQILPGSEAFEPVVYLGRIHLVGCSWGSGAFRLI